MLFCVLFSVGEISNETSFRLLVRVLLAAEAVAAVCELLLEILFCFFLDVEIQDIEVFFF